MAEIDHELEQLTRDALAALANVNDEAGLETWHTAYLGRRGGAISERMRTLGQLPADERRVAGQRFNAAKDQLDAAYTERREQVRTLTLDRSFESERIDVTMPARKLHTGGLHPTTQTLRRILEIFRDLGFQVCLLYTSPSPRDS